MPAGWVPSEAVRERASRASRLASDGSITSISDSIFTHLVFSSSVVVVSFFFFSCLFIYLAMRGLVAARGLFSLHGGMWDLLVVSCGISFPDQGSNLGPLGWKHGVLATGLPGKSLSTVMGEKAEWEGVTQMGR